MQLHNDLSSQGLEVPDAVTGPAASLQLTMTTHPVHGGCLVMAACHVGAQ